MTFVYRRGGRNHQGLGCTDQQQPHKQETPITSMEDHHRSILEPHQDHRQPHTELKLPNLDLLHPTLELLLPRLHSCWVRRLRTVHGRRAGSTLRKVGGKGRQRGAMTSLTTSQCKSTRLIQNWKGQSTTLPTALRVSSR